ncbi:MAG: hypothetical protein H7Z43_11440 [Clostridia bacterium]|nr:hypothetical protein [Deltaproteobacteria bacterium]
MTSIQKDPQRFNNVARTFTDLSKPAAVPIGVTAGLLRGLVTGARDLLDPNTRKTFSVNEVFTTAGAFSVLGALGASALAASGSDVNVVYASGLSALFPIVGGSFVNYGKFVADSVVNGLEWSLKRLAPFIGNKIAGKWVHDEKLGKKVGEEIHELAGKVEDLAFEIKDAVKDTAHAVGRGDVPPDLSTLVPSSHNANACAGIILRTTPGAHDRRAREKCDRATSGG